MNPDLDRPQPCPFEKLERLLDGVRPTNPFYQIYEGATPLAGCRPIAYAIGENADADLDAANDNADTRISPIIVKEIRSATPHRTSSLPRATS